MGFRLGKAAICWIALLSTVAVALVVVTERVETQGESPYPISRTIRFNQGALVLAEAKAGFRADVIRGDVPLELPLEPGQTVGAVLAELNLEPRDVVAIVDELEEYADLRSLRPTDGYSVLLEPGTERVAAFDLTLASRGRVRVAKRDGDWAGSYRAYRRWSDVRVVAGTLEGGLETSIERAGGDPRVAFKMSEVLQWDLDFNRDLRLGDRFEVVYERVFVDGSHSALGEVLAVTYTNMGKTLEAFRFGDPVGYYDADGRPLRKMFLRSPMPYSRVTSRFSNRRFHPVLKVYRPHHGVDYGAPTGTPVRVTSNGVVSSAAWDKGAGRMVKVRHPNGYMTAYLHLSKFAKGIRSGRRVSQGDTIGYVGSTGLATGPHLDYRVQHHGRWIDPLSLRSVPAEPIPVEDKEAFAAWREAYRASFTSLAPTPELSALRAKQQPLPSGGQLAEAGFEIPAAPGG